MIRIALLSAALLLSGCHNEPDEWSGFVYPNKTDLTDSANIGVYDSLEACRSAAGATLNEKGSTNGDYECGLNCSGSLCEKTSK